MSLLAKKHADEVREMWQSKALRVSQGKLRRVVTVALAKEYPAALITLMKVTFPGFIDLDRPMFISYATIAPDGRIVCDMIAKDGSKRKVAVYSSESLFVYEMRKLADKMKLSDKDRIEMFTILQKWVTRDQRVGVLGEKLAS